MNQNFWMKFFLTKFFTLTLTLILSCTYRTKTMSSQGKAMSDSMMEVAKKYSSDEVFLVRFNPPHCECAEFEVLLDDRWYRIMIKTSSELQEEFKNFVVKAQNDIKENKLLRYKLKGSLKKNPLQCKSGSFYFMLEVEGFNI